MTALKLIAENNLEQAETGLWHLPGAEIEQNFAYSDGDNEESYVSRVIADSQDTSSTSAELEQYIHDWPSEYHLTSKRAHLLRALDLSGLKNVLELGCGCGAISRYLGEQGMSVEAIEGSRRRAGIARSRCRDLDNVSIVNANFNHLRLPQNSYDAVFLIGVLEYAKRFCPDAADDRTAVLEILHAVQKSLTPDGVVITAIENRLGLKYLMGASEDHYGVPYIGIHGYPDSAGIRTYDHSEWCSILQQAGFDQNRFLTPFPDYKIPTVVLHEEFLQQAEASVHLRGSVSRDYLRGFSSDFDEYLFWQACNQNDSLLDFANSFLIIGGAGNKTAEKIAAYDFTHCSGSQRKPEYRTVTRKRRGEAVVRKEKLNAETRDTGLAAGIWQVCKDEPWIAGQLLADNWLQTLMIWQDPQRLSVLYKDYFGYLKDYRQQHPDAKDMLDILPFNIVIEENGSYRSFDREWESDEAVTVEYILFRALFWFVYGNSRPFGRLLESRQWQSIREYIEYCFTQLGVSLPDGLNTFAEQEDRFQASTGTVDSKTLVSDLLDTLPQASSGDVTFHPRLYWAPPGEACSEQNSIRATAVLGGAKQKIAFNLPVALAAGSLIRFDPAEQEGYFHLFSLKLLADGEVLLDLASTEEITDRFNMTGISVCTIGNDTVFLSRDSDPFLECRVETAVENLRLEVEMDWPHSEEYAIVRAGLRQEFSAWVQEKSNLQKQVCDLQQALQDREKELNSIQASKAYRASRKLTGLLKK